MQATHTNAVQAFIAETETHPMASEKIGRRNPGRVPSGESPAAPN